MFKDFIPSSKQYKKWNKPSKLTFWGTFLGLIGLGFAIFTYFVPNNSNHVSEALSSTSKVVDNHYSTANNPDYGFSTFPFSFNSTNVLIVSFYDFQDYHENEKKIERIIQQRIADLKYKNILSKETKVEINVKCAFLDKDYNDFDTIKNLGEKCRADIVIYGNLFDVSESNSRQVQIKFLIFPALRRDKTIQAKTDLKTFVNWGDLVEGSLLKDLDYVVYWLIAYDQMDRGNIDNLISITDFLNTKFQNDSISEFNKSFSSLLTFEAIPICSVDKNYDISHRYFSKAIEYDPDNYWAYFWLGSTYNLGYGDVDKALEYTHKANKLSPNNSTIMEALSDLYYSKGDIDLSKKYAISAVESDPENAQSHVQLGKILCTSFHKFDLARVHLKKAIELDKNSSSGYFFYCLTLYYEKNISKNYFSYLSKALEINPKDPASHALMAFGYTLKNDYLKAEEHYLRAIEISPNEPYFHFKLSELYFDYLLIPEMGKKHMLEAIRIDPKSAEYHYIFAIKLEKNLKDFESAQLHYSKAKKIDPDYTWIDSWLDAKSPDN